MLTGCILAGQLAEIITVPGTIQASGAFMGATIALLGMRHIYFTRTAATLASGADVEATSRKSD